MREIDAVGCNFPLAAEFHYQHSGGVLMSKRANSVLGAVAILCATAIGRGQVPTAAPAPLGGASFNGWVTGTYQGANEETCWWNTPTGEWAAHVAEEGIVT